MTLWWMMGLILMCLTMRRPLRITYRTVHWMHGCCQEPRVLPVLTGVGPERPTVWLLLPRFMCRVQRQTRHTETDRERQTQKGIDRERQTERDRQRETDRERERERETDRERQTERDRQRERERDRP